MYNALEKFYRHKELFAIQADPYLNLFETLIRDSQHCSLECSCKVARDKLFPCRFNIWYDNASNISTVATFLENVSQLGAKLNLSLFKRIYSNKIHLRTIQRMIVGIDLRQPSADSRAKFWLITDRNDCDLFNLVFGWHGNTERISEFIIKNELLFGFDFFFNKKTKIKIYPFFTSYELRNNVIRRKLEKVFSPACNKLISQCDRFFISFDGKDFVRTLHFEVENVNKLVTHIKNRQLHKMLNRIGGQLPGCIISLCEKEIDAGQIEDFNFYY